ncbi:hypothetical protein [Streptomyces sp. 2P-4]|uniref:hypothetical protein n=1 Tax=Streptomyces sp. 2P-4 TaxID=2931974 RepID=UPI002541BE09|nr:hypothetical protein [Streptomyces sp. 2P-4]
MTHATYVRIAELPLTKLKPFEGNAKRGDVDVILDSLRRNGQYRSLIVRETSTGKGPFTILAGNHTADAFKLHGPGDCGQLVTAGTETRPCGICGNDAKWKPVARCEVIDCDDDTARRVNLVDNRSAALGSYDDAALAELLSGLDNLDGTAYVDDDLDELLKATGALGEQSAEFLASFMEPAAEQPPAAPAAAAPPALNPFSGVDSQAGPPHTAPPSTLPQTGTEDAHAPAPAPVPYSPGVHTGPTAYDGPGARSHPGEGIEIPPPVQMVPLQWVFTLDQRDTVRAAIKAEQAANGHDTGALALTAICAAYLQTTSEAS